MIVPDVNLLIYAHNRAAPLHASAKRWWEVLITEQRPVGMPWAVLFGFIRLVTHPSVLVSPLPPLDAVRRTRGWIERSNVRLLDPGPRHLDLVAELFGHTKVAANLTTDTHLAALAIEHQAELHSNDSDFARFPGLRWYNPLS